MAVAEDQDNRAVMEKGREKDRAGPATSSNGISQTLPADSRDDGEIVLSRDCVDRQWDNFLNQIPGVYFAQSSLWAAAKSFQGWDTLRLTVRQRDDIVGGIQMLTREMPVLGNVGYVSRGPVLRDDDPDLMSQLVGKLLQQAGHNRTQALILQPHGLGKGPGKILLDKGFRPTERSVAPVHTLLLDLEPSSDDILAQMTSRTRYNVRLSGRKEIAIREGTDDDLNGFIQLARMTGERQGFVVPTASFLQRLWERFAPEGHIKLFLAEYRQEVISAQLAISFGDTVFNKLTVWSGKQGKRKPNDGLMWGAIQWAKTNGYRKYDFGGLSPKGANHYQDKEPLPEELKGTVTSFKLGFGGRIVTTPQAYLYVGNSFLRWIDKKVIANYEQSKHIKRFANRIRTQ